MLDELVLKERFESLLAKEAQAADAYRQLVKSLNDPDQVKLVHQMIRDKQRHIELTRRLLEMVD